MENKVIQYLSRLASRVLGATAGAATTLALPRQDTLEMPESNMAHFDGRITTKAVAPREHMEISRAYPLTLEDQPPNEPAARFKRMHIDRQPSEEMLGELSPDIGRSPTSPSDKIKR